MPRPPLTPGPLCQLGATLEPSHPAALNQIPSSVNTSTKSVPMYIHSSGLAEQSIAGDSYLTSSSSAGSSPTLHTSSSPMPSGATWRPGQPVDELSVELEMRERLRTRPREVAKDSQVSMDNWYRWIFWTLVAFPNIGDFNYFYFWWIYLVISTLSIQCTISFLLFFPAVWKFPSFVPATGARMHQRETRHRRTGTALYVLHWWRKSTYFEYLVRQAGTY